MTAPAECMCCGEVATLRTPDLFPVCAECAPDGVECEPWFLIRCAECDGAAS